MGLDLSVRTGMRLRFRHIFGVVSLLLHRSDRISFTPGVDRLMMGPRLSVGLVC